MSKKKTWFSYILWLFATGFCVLFTYYCVTAIVMDYHLTAVKKYYWQIGITVMIITALGVLYALFDWINRRNKRWISSRWGRRFLHILILCAVIGIFGMTRYQALWSVGLEQIMPMDIYESAKVVSGNTQNFLSGNRVYIKDIYMGCLSGLFLFLGNKMEIILYFQICLQVISLLLLLIIGRTLQKGFLAWIPVLIYGVTPYCVYSVIDLNTGNFTFGLWLFVVLLYLLAVQGIQRTLDSRPEIMTGQNAGRVEAGLKTETNSVMEGMSEPEGATAVIVGGDKALERDFTWAEMKEFMDGKKPERIKSEIRKVQKEKPTLTNTKEAEGTEIEDAAEREYAEETGPIRVSDILKAAGSLTEESQENIQAVPDKTAPIENVLPMPKKHVARTFEYAFEPAEDMMHYDVELAEDDYDYE